MSTYLLDLQLLAAAKNAEVGIRIQTTDPVKHRSRLMGLQRKDKDYECLSITLSPHKPLEEIWIINRPKYIAAKATLLDIGKEPLL